MVSDQPIADYAKHFVYKVPSYVADEMKYEVTFLLYRYSAFMDELRRRMDEIAAVSEKCRYVPARCGKLAVAYHCGQISVKRKRRCCRVLHF